MSFFLEGVRRTSVCNTLRPRPGVPGGPWGRRDVEPPLKGRAHGGYSTG